MQIVNFSVPGSAFDFQITLLMEQIDNIDWNKDLVLFGTPTPLCSSFGNWKNLF